MGEKLEATAEESVAVDERVEAREEGGREEGGRDQGDTEGGTFAILVERDAI